MTAAVTATPAAGTAHTTAFNVACTGLSSNDSTAYDSTRYPTEPQLKYWFQFSASGQPTLKSPVFAPSEGGTAEWHNVLIPAAATWTLDVIEASDGVTSAATASVVVS